MQIAELDKLIENTLDHELAREKAGRLQQMNGISEAAAATLMAELPALGTLDDSRIASLTGLAPPYPEPIIESLRVYP